MDLWVKLLGIFLGVLSRTYLPYLRKLRTGKVKKFEMKYMGSAFASFSLAIVATLLVFPQFDIVNQGVTVESCIKVFALAFGFGYGFNGILSEGAKWMEQRQN